MNTQTVSIPGPHKEKVAGAVTGEEKYTFLYFAMGGVGLTAAIYYASMAHLSALPSVLLLIGLPLVACAFVFSFMEVRRAARRPATGAPAVDLNQYATRTVDVNPPTGEPYPHHEDFPESQGFDQSQLTARIPGSTPFLDILERRAEKRNARKAPK